VHTADAAGPHEPDSRTGAHGQGAAGGGGTQSALHRAGCQVAGAHLASGRAGLGEALKLGRVEPNPDCAADYADRGRDRAVRPDPLLGRLRGGQAAAAREAMRDQGRLQGHHGLTQPERTGHLVDQQQRDRHGIAPIVATARAATRL
jgi:hypothetical protein